MSIKLVVKVGKLAGKEIPVRINQFVIGRDETCHLRPNSSVVSKLHCAIVVADDSVWLRDLKSTNGTFHNNERVTDRVQLHHGDTIQVGPLVLEIHMPERTKPAEQKAEQKPEPKAAQTPTKPAAAKKKPAVDDDDVFEWLSEEGEEEAMEPISEDSDHTAIGQQPTMVDMNIETVPEIKDMNPKTPPKPAAKEDSSNAASNLLKGMFHRKR